MPRRPHPWWTAATVALVGALMVGSGSAVADERPTATDVTITSHDGTQLAATVYRPVGASRHDPVPVILHSHGWAGSRTSDPQAFAAERRRGFGVVSFDQRGHGDSGGQAHVQDPDLEGRDVMAVLDFVAELDWVRRSGGQGARPGADDPVVVAMGGSYGGAYQLVGALTETALSGDTRFDALAPEITWFDLTESLAPEGVVRSAWVAALYAAGADMLPEYIHRGFAWGASTGQWPDGSAPGVPDLEDRLFAHGPSGFVARGERLDVPTLFGQGASDNLFNLNQGWHNFERTLSDGAREDSLFIGYNGGHALPSVLPPGRPLTLDVGTVDDGCSPGGFAQLRLDFFEAVLDDDDPRELVGDAPYHLTTADGACVAVDALDRRTRFVPGVDVELDVTVPSRGPGYDRADGLIDDVAVSLDAAVRSGLGGAATTTGAGAPVHLELADGPLTVAGIPTLSAKVTSAGVEQRVFAALSVGSSPATAKLVQNNMMPLRLPKPVVGEPHAIELPGVAVDLAGNEQLYLTLSAVSDTSFAHGSVRTPGMVRLDDLRVDVPLVGADCPDPREGRGEEAAPACPPGLDGGSSRAGR